LRKLNVILAFLLVSIALNAQDSNILAYTDRGIKYYPRYVPKGTVKVGKASWYGKQFHKKLTANGERYNMYSMTAAHRTYAMNTVLRVTNLANWKSVKVRVNDRGPFYRSRDIDLSYGAAKKLGLTKKGIGRVKIEVIASSKNKKSKNYHKIKDKSIDRTHKVQVASFFKKEYAKEFKRKHKLKNVEIIKKYIASKRKTAYRVVVQCTSWEAKKLLESKKFSGAYLLS
jgi:rare lipoprotein A